MDALSAGLTALAEFLGYTKQRDAENNAGDIKLAAKAFDEERARAEDIRLAATGSLEDIRKASGE